MRLSKSRLGFSSQIAVIGIASERSFYWKEGQELEAEIKENKLVVKKT